MANSRQGTGKVQFRGMIPQSQRLLSQRSVGVSTRYLPVLSGPVVIRIRRHQYPLTSPTTLPCHGFPSGILARLGTSILCLFAELSALLVFLLL